LYWSNFWVGNINIIGMGLFHRNLYIQDEFEDTKEAIRIRKSKKNRHHTGERKKYKRTLVVNTSLSFPHLWLITGFVNRSTQWVSLVEHELLTFPEHLSSSPVISGVRVTRSLVLWVCFIDRSLSFCTFSFRQCGVCSS
jgi:hypothetical protein